MYRLLITGSRAWKDEGAIEIWLKKVDFAHKEVTLVSGSCPNGADTICEKVARRLGWIIERHPVNWKPDGVHVDFNQGFVRNKEMVDMGADACLAFMLPDSRGTANTVGHAIRAGIPTTLVGEKPFFVTFKPE